MERVIVTRPIFGIAGMQVCANDDATDEEILTVCNEQNPSGTSNGWSQVIRTPQDEDSLHGGEKYCPVTCSDNPDRKHFIVTC